ncbi:rhodanese-like domain-containing protein [Lentzea sp. NPDC051208]|uniref:rhodanese-like domain-containing protein n=1 Tax=Lentzea sp. NPDC051208 TaxID=3154642 RepID=UPI00341EBC96
MRGPDQDPAEIAWQAAKIGYADLVELASGMDAWTAAGLPTTTTRLVGPGDVRGSVLDIRQSAEFAFGLLPGGQHVGLGDLPARAGDVPREPLVVMCGHGERAMGAASLLEQAGHRDVAVLTGGPRDWAAATGGRLESGR